ncbi:unnamed protein product [Ixodes hexagonus]
MQFRTGATHFVASVILTFAVGGTVAHVINVQPLALEKVIGPLRQQVITSELKDPRENAVLEGLRTPLGLRPEAFRDDEGKPSGNAGLIREAMGPQGGPTGLDLMRVLLSNFGRLPGMNPRFAEDGADFMGSREGLAAGQRINRTSAVDKIGAGGPDVGFISVDFEMIIIPAANETGGKNASRRSLPRHKFLPRNRSAYVVLDTYPVKAVEDSSVRGLSPRNTDSSLADSDSGGVLKLSLLALFMLMACGVSCVLGTTLPILWKRHNADRTSVWVTKTGNLFRLRGGPDAAPHLPAIHRSCSDWST